MTDARRREVYWAAYDGGVRITGPHVEAPAALVGPDPRAGCRRGRRRLRRGDRAAGGRPRRRRVPAGLVACALDALRAGVRPGPLEPLYLRRPDAVAPGPRKPVTAG